VNRFWAATRSPKAAAASEEGRGASRPRSGAKGKGRKGGKVVAKDGSGSGGGVGGGGGASGAAFESAGAGESAGGGIMVTSGHPISHPQVFVVPYHRRPLMPGIVSPVRIYDEALISEVGRCRLTVSNPSRERAWFHRLKLKYDEPLCNFAFNFNLRRYTELEDMRNRGQAYVGVFLKKSGSDDFTKAAAGVSAGGEDLAGVDGENTSWDPSDDMHDVGTFAQVQNIVRFGMPALQDAADDDADGVTDGALTGSAGGGATLLLRGHRRLRKTHTVRSDPMMVRVEHLRDNPHDGDDVVAKATANEVVATMMQFLKFNPMAKETLSYFQHNITDWTDPSRLADLAASLTSVDDGALQEILEHLEVRDRLAATLDLLKREVELGKLQVEIGKRVEDKVSAEQRRYFLKEQLKFIKNELGIEKDDKSALMARFIKNFAPFRAGIHRS
jgi:Lon-like ATP-dependent protease